MEQATGKYLIAAGLLILIVGIVVYGFHDKFHWIGRLPGDFRLEKPGLRFYFPLTTMILFSILLSVLLWLLKKFL